MTCKHLKVEGSGVPQYLMLSQAASVSFKLAPDLIYLLIGCRGVCGC